MDEIHTLRHDLYQESESKRSAPRADFSPKRDGILLAASGNTDRYRRLVESNIIGIIVVRLDGSVLEANDAFLEMLGYTRADLTAGAVRWDAITPAEFRGLDEAAIGRLKQTGRAEPWEKEYFRRDGSRVPVMVGVSMLDDADEQCLCFVLDLSERQRAERRFRHVLEAAPDAMVLVDPQGRISLVNAQAERLFGYRREELLGQTIGPLIPERFRHRHEALVDKFFARPQTRPMGGGLELFGLRKDGSEFPAEISLGPLETEQGTMVLCAVRDTSERKAAERKISQREAQLLAARQIQEHLLPETPPELPGFDVAAATFPAEIVAGDYYDYVPLPDGSMGFVVADVSGHGIGPALLMASTHAHLNSCAQTHTGIGEILARLNRFLVSQTEDERFVTMVLARLDPSAGTLFYANAGHPAGYVLDAEGRLKARLESNSLPLGVQAETSFTPADPVTLQSGDLVLLLTDGVLEAFSPGGEPFGTARALETARAYCGRPAHEIVAALYLAVSEFSGRQVPLDDLTVMAIKSTAARAAAAER